MIRPAARSIIDAVIADHAARWTEHELATYRHRIVAQIDADIRAAAAGSADPYVLSLLSPTSAGVSLTRAGDRYEVTFASRSHRLNEVVGSIGPRAGSTSIERRLATAQAHIDASARLATDPTVAAWVRKQAARDAGQVAADVVDADDRRAAAADAIARNQADARNAERMAREESAIQEVMAALEKTWPSYLHCTPQALRAAAIQRLNVPRVEQD